MLRCCSPSRRFTLPFLLLLGLLAGACGDDPATSPGDGPDAGLNANDVEAHRQALTGSPSHIVINGQEVAALSLQPIQVASDVVMADCFEQLRKSPGGATFFSDTPPGSVVRSGCAATTDTNLSVVSTVTFGDYRPIFNAGTTCEQQMCRAQVELCVAHRLMELSASVQPTTFNALLDPTKLTTKFTNNPQLLLVGTTPAKVTIPPADAESAAALQEMAFHFAARAVEVAGENLRKGYGITPDGFEGVCAPAVTTTTPVTPSQLNSLVFTTSAIGNDITYGAAFASLFSEATLVASEAARGSARATTAVAEADQARIPDQALATKLAWTVGALSRARAAHVLIGGVFTAGLGDYRTSDASVIDASTAQSFCPSDELTGKDAEALDLLRLAAPSPARLDNKDVTLQALFEQDGAGNDRSVLFRLGERLGDPSIATMGLAAFLTSRRLDEQNFVAARRYIAFEIKAFARDPNLLLAPIPIAAGPTGTPRFTTASLYVATGSPPVTPPAVHYQVMARFAGGALFDMQDATAVTGAPAIVKVKFGWATNNLSSILDYSRMVATHLLSSATSDDAAKLRAVQDVLATQLGADGGRTTARLETCERKPDSATTEMRVRLYGTGLVAADQLLVVGTSGLRCAVEGSVEGAPCTLSSYLLGATGVGGAITSGPTLASVTNAPWVGFPSYVEIMVRPPTYTTSPPPIYLVHRKTPGTSPTSFDPGNYEAVGGFRAPISSTVSPSANYNSCAIQPIMADLNAEAQAILTPTPASCSQAALSCAGMSTADKLPLESELSDDGNGIESSWRVFLARARDAADRADRLGEQLIESGLAMDQRTESSVENLATLCGSEVSLSDFFPSNMSGYLGPTCTAAQEGLSCVGMTPPAGQPMPAEGQVCRGGRCVADPLAILESKRASDPAAARLLECLGVGTLKDVSLGSNKACVWQNKTTKRYCEPIAGRECPYLATNGDCGADPNAATRVIPLEPLALFSPPDDSENSGDKTDPPACSALRTLREQGGTIQSRQRLIRKLNTGFFSAENVRAFASRLGWEAGPDDYSAITLDGSPIYRTGSIFDSPVTSATWPCTPGVGYTDRETPLGVPLEACPTSSTESAPSFFCASTSCGVEADRVRRARMNQRMGRAVLALKILSGAGLGSDFRGPYEMTDFFLLTTGTGDWGSGPDMKNPHIEWPEGNHNVTATGGRSLTTASTMRYKVIDDDPGDDDVATADVTGMAVCFNANPATLWTSFQTVFVNGLPSSSTPPLVVTHTASCTGNLWFPLFKVYPASQGTNPGPHIGQFWLGLDGTPQVVNLDTDFTGLARRLLYNAGHEQDMVLGRRDARAAEITSYWTDERILFEGNPLATTPVPENKLKIAPEGLTKADILDGMEVMCEAARRDTPGFLRSSCAPAPTPSSLSDLDAVEHYLRCAANEMRERAELEVFMQMPSIVLEALSPGFQLEGELEAAAGEFASSLVSFHNQELILNSVLESFSEDLKRLRIVMRQQQISSQLVNINKWSTIANQTAACLHEATAAADLTNANGGFFGGRAAAAVTCANSATQIAFALESAGLQQENVELEGDMKWIDFQSKFRGYGETLQKATDQLTADGAAMRAALARITSKREAGIRELSRAMMLGTDAAGNMFASNTVMRRRYNTQLIRYQQALKDAVKLAFIARRAIEQRLGLRFNEMHRNMLLVEAPATWADEVCTISGVDYTRIRSEGGLDADDYSNQFLGDYVNKLEMVVNSYDHDYPFHEGADTAVISVRDDISLARRTCDISAPNLLAQSSRLNVGRDPETYGDIRYKSVNDDPSTPAPAHSGPAPVWTERYMQAGVSAVALVPLNGTQLANWPIPAASATGGDVVGFQVNFTPAVGNPTTTSKLAAVGQDVALHRGFYRLSWYGRRLTGTSPVPIDPGIAVTMRKSDAIGTELVRTNVRADAPSASGWARYYAVFQVDSDDTYVVTFNSDITKLGAQRLDLGALMLEDVTELYPNLTSVTGVSLQDAAPVQYVATTEAGVGHAAVCEDTDGSVFRTMWVHRCEQLCPAGYGTCDGGQVQCFYELPIDIGLEDIEGGRLLAQTGFAYGNYNYRIDNLAINLVGTGIRDCSGSSLPTTCQSNASLPFSLEHIGPYVVRNHKGETYQAQLFEGRIEHGRALGAERYITNPISSADRSLLDPYRRHELSGRPLTGRYRLRIWDVDGTAFKRIEDVQLILDYRYWTRFE